MSGPRVLRIGQRPYSLEISLIASALLSELQQPGTGQRDST